ncbi:hypothetical protein D3C86_2142460 [compost metagenome]
MFATYFQLRIGGPPDEFAVEAVWPVHAHMVGVVFKIGELEFVRKCIAGCYAVIPGAECFVAIRPHGVYPERDAG